ncbi:hypothetical protein F4780DRAFT_733750 [Xylariomycetidae sp. FL0641]|nr:hypothetical protein F4780DRAFT_733750 [Xylariomycetidae sp. FL0641]
MARTRNSGLRNTSPVAAAAAEPAAPVSSRTRRYAARTQTQSTEPVAVRKRTRAAKARQPAEDVAVRQEDVAEIGEKKTDAMSWPARNQWMVYAVASGACAAFNGVFAKLTTNDLTTHISRALSSALGLSSIETYLEIGVRCIFFGLNLAFNGVMWTLFTQALARGHSTTQVSIMNTSANFMLTALLGLAIFAESLPPLWWAGAALLVVGNVIIGRKDEGGATAEAEAPRDAAAYADEEEEQEAAELEEGVGGGEGSARGRGARRVEKDDEEPDEDVALLGDLDAPER